MADDLLVESVPLPAAVEQESAKTEDVTRNNNSETGLREAPINRLTELDNISDLIASIDQDADPTEYSKQVGRKAQISQYGSLGTRQSQRDKKAGLVEARSRQAVLHLTYAEMRITELEKTIKNVQDFVHNKPKTKASDSPDPKYPVHKHEIWRSAFEAFRISKQTYDVPSENLPALKVLGLRSLESTTVQSASNLDPEIPLYETITITRQVPERLRIRSRPLLVHLKQVTGESIEINDTTHKDERPLYPGTVFLRSFKVFVKNEQQIRESLSQLRSKIKDTSTADEKPPEVAARSQRQNVPMFKDEDVLMDLELLVTFLDNDLRPTFDLRRGIADVTATEIEFADLWHLFERRTICVNRSEASRAYRLINSTGGREPLIDMMRKGEERTSAHDGFVVDCLSLGSDGSDYVPKLHKFTVPKYSGSQPINLLAVFPPEFHPDVNKIKAEVRVQARLFLQVTAPPFSHHMMIGKTVDEPSHEVDAQVIIDMAVATNTILEWRRATKVGLDDLTKVDMRETCLQSSANTAWRDIVAKALSQKTQVWVSTI
ncbi:hypothetical protein SCUP515_13110 [Seiridium cupressi]